LGDFTVGISDVVCFSYAQQFVELYQTGSECSDRGWNTYRAVYTGTFFPAIRESSNVADCLARADALGGVQGPVARPICQYVSGLVIACGCDKMSCVTDSVNAGVSSFCNTFPQKMCRSFQPMVNSTCDAAFKLPPPSGGEIEFNTALVPHGCDENSCRAASTNGGFRMSTNGVFWAAGLVALIVSVL